MTWTPHATVATIVEREGQFLMVEETSQGLRVFNQPAGHVEEGESIFDAAIRETLEETGWLVRLTGLVGLYTYLAPNGVTYYRICFAAEAIEHQTERLDPDIIAAHWMSLSAIQDKKDDSLRSPLVLRCLEDCLSRPHLPLNSIYEHPAKS